MTSFASLMAISASHTRESQQAVEHALQERKRKEALQRKQQEEKEAKEREQEKKMRMKRFEEEKRQREREERREAERKAKELAAQRREDEQRDSLRYGPKKAAKMTNGSNPGGNGGGSSSRSDVVRKRKLDDDDDDDDGPPGVVLTREEIRQKKQQAEMRKLFSSSKGSSRSVPSYRRAGQRLPGGAVNIINDPSRKDGQEASSSSLQGGVSVRERILHMPNSLTKLNTNKKDNRTMDEILTDIQVKKKGKVLEGESATAFDDWFGTKSKKAEQPPQRKSPVSASISPPLRESEQRPSKYNSPVPSASFSASSMHKPARPSSTKPIPSAGHKPLPSTSRASSSDIYPSSSQPNKLPKISKSYASAAASQPPRRSTTLPSAHRPDPSSRQRKRTRSPSLSDSPSPPPAKKRSLKDDISSEIWSLFGKDRSQYTARDVMSDDEDMEVDARVLELEEKKSSRIAKKEEMFALEQERQHEEEKRRRKKEKERYARG